MFANQDSRFCVRFQANDDRSTYRKQIIDAARHRLSGVVFAVGNDPDVGRRKETFQFCFLEIKFRHLGMIPLNHVYALLLVVPA
jgi:hypothetical protein